MIGEIKGRVVEMVNEVGEVGKIIVTHAGQAHADDFLAVAVLLVKFPNAKVVRVNDPAAISDSSAIFVDIGNKYDGKRFFDHHQDKNLPASFILVMKTFYPEINTDIDVLRWISDWDIMGPITAMKKWGVKLLEFPDPISDAMLSIFNKVTIINPEDPLHWVLREIGKTFIENIKNAAEFIRKAREAEIFEVKGLKVVKISENIPIRFIKAVHKDVAIIVSPNQRERAAWSVTRVDDHPQVDFRRIKVPAKFIHQNGFMAVVEPEYIEKAIEEAICSPICG